jgi:hypothetical protein
MAISKTKATTIAITLFLMFLMGASLVALPVANAQPPPPTPIEGKSKAYAFIGATPNPVGVGQETLLHLGITQQKQSTAQKWVGLTVTVTKPDGTTETLGGAEGFKTDATGGTGTSFVPSMEGTYKLQTHFPGQWFNFTVFDFATFTNIPYNLYFEAADSDVLELVVTAEPTPVYPGVPLPTEYWTRPIDAQAHEWSVITGDWLGIGQFGDMLAGVAVSGNEDAPETAHILWTQPMVTGGLAGDPMGNHAYHMGDAYEGWFSGSIIIDGKLFYNRFNSISSANENSVVAVDLHTGKILWEKPLLTPEGDHVDLDFGWVMYWDSFNVHGVFAYLVAQTGGYNPFGPSEPEAWHMFDPVDGRWLFDMTNLPSGSTVVGPNGELIRYQLDLSGGYMTMWNSTAVTDAYWGGNTPDNPAWGSWRPQGKTINATGPCAVTYATPFGLNGYQWNVTIPKDLPGSVDYVVALDYALGYYRNTYGFGGEAINNPPFTVWSIDLRPGHEGDLKFKETYNLPAGNLTVGYRRYGYGDNRAFIVHIKEECTNYGYDLDTGKKLWGPSDKEFYLSYLETWTIIYDGKAYTHGTKGIVDCYDLYTGEKLWSYAADDPVNQILWSNNWNIRVDFIADGKIYLRHSEHSPVDPMPRGAPYVCLNATTGEVIWRADGLFRGTDWGGHAKIGDSIIATMDTYDMRIYGIGKGPTATSITASPKVSTYGDQVLVEGLVTDISPGTEQYSLTARFPNGVPAVADDNQSAWMLYVYKQFPRPTDAIGVGVTISVLDPNNNAYEVGTTTSDASGFYKLTFTPQVPGEYTIIATFAGSKAYYGSYSETAINVGETPAGTPPPTAPPAPMTDTYVLGIGAAAIIAIVAVGLVLILMLKKR